MFFFINVDIVEMVHHSEENCTVPFVWEVCLFLALHNRPKCGCCPKGWYCLVAFDECCLEVLEAAVEKVC